MSSLTRKQLVETLHDILGKRPEVLEAYLFGSRATERNRTNSDIDIAVFVDKTICNTTPLDYQAELISSLQAALKFNAVDLVLLNHATPLLHHRVLRDGVRVYSRDLKQTTTREGYALSRYCDFVPFQKKLDQILDARFDNAEFGQ